MPKASDRFSCRLSGFLLTLLIIPFWLTDSVRAEPLTLTGRKYLLSIGINQYKSKPLRGCVNDATGVRETLVQQFGFDARDATLLTDQRATREGILSSLREYLDIVGPGDLFVLFYSGHGSLFPDAITPLRDESTVLDLSAMRVEGVNLQDGRYDSTLVPIDAHQPTGERPWGNMILDDELYDLFSRMTERGALVLFLSDSCHSGSLARSITLDERHKFLAPEEVLGRPVPDSLHNGLPNGAERIVAKGSLGGRLLAITASQDNQFSVDGIFDNRPQGRFTYSLQRVIARSGSTLTYQQAFAEVRREVVDLSRGTQTPALDRRYFEGSLDVPVFSLPFGPAASSGPVQLRLILRSRSGQIIPRGNIALFPKGLEALPDRITRANTLVVVTTQENGEALSAPIELTGGEYLVKALADGFDVFTGRVRIRPTKGQATLLLVLDPQ